MKYPINTEGTKVSKSFFSSLGASFAKGSAFSVGCLLTWVVVVYAISYPNNAPAGEMPGGKFMYYLNAMLVNTGTTTDGTVKKSEWVGISGGTQAIHVTNTGDVGIGIVSPGAKLDVQWAKLNVWAPSSPSEFCLNGNCVSKIPDSQKGDILFAVRRDILGNQISTSYGATANERANNLMVAAWKKGVERVWAYLGWSATRINDTKNAYTNIDQMRQSIQASWSEWWITLISGYLVPGLKALGYGQYTLWLDGCAGTPVVMWCSEWYACGYETFQPGIDAYAIMSCIGR